MQVMTTSPMVDPDNEIIEVRYLKSDAKRYTAERIFNRGERVKSKVLPGFSPSVSEIFDAIPRKTK